jgi:Raf kinase inhibitor-like YbhB/YbcL family protein
MPLRIFSPAFLEGQEIPARHTRDGMNVSPPLTWSGQPPNASTIAVVCEDMDSMASRNVHWLLYDVPAGAGEIAEGACDVGIKGRTSSGVVRYDGPALPAGVRHRYCFRVFALDVASIGPPGMDREPALAAIKAHMLSEGILTGTYKRPPRPHLAGPGPHDVAFRLSPGAGPRTGDS